MFAAFQQRIGTSRLHKVITRSLQPLTRHRQKRKLRGLFRWKRKPGVEGPPDEPERQSGLLRTASGLGRRFHPWTRTHSAFAVMGGFAFDNSSAPEAVPFPDRRTRLVIPPRGLEFLGQHYPELIPDISEEEIKDKSKADGLTKALACLQALYFLAQSIFRLASGLPITLLELNTVSHCLCALATYILWWYKPFDVMEPVLIPTSGTAGQVCAAMCMRSSIGYWILQKSKPGNELGRLERLGWEDRETHYSGIVEFHFDPVGDESGRTTEAGRDGYGGAASDPSGTILGLERRQTEDAIQSPGSNPSARLPSSPPRLERVLPPSPTPEGDDGLELHRDVPRNGLVMRLTSYGNILKSESYTFAAFSYVDFAGYEHSTEFPNATVTINPSTLRLCNLARPVIRQHPDELMTPLTGERRFWDWGRRVVAERVIVCNRGGDLVCDRMENFPHATVSGGVMAVDWLRCVAGVAIANVCYGGIHLLAWNGPFRTAVESRLWRISAISLCVPFVTVPLIVTLFYVVIFLAKLMNPAWRPEEDQTKPRPDQAGFSSSGLYADPTVLNTQLAAATWVALSSRLKTSKGRPWAFLTALAQSAVFAISQAAFVIAFMSLGFAFTYGMFIGRPFVLVECVLALPYSPAAVYLTPDWTSYWPHFS